MTEVAALFLLIGQASLPVPPRVEPDRLAIITDHPLEAKVRSEIEGKSLLDGIAFYEKMGYHRADDGSVALLISPSLWAARELDELQAIWREAQDAVGADGTVSLGRSPTLARYLTSAYQAVGYDGVDGASLALVSRTTVTVGKGTDRKSIMIPGGDDQARREGLQNRLKTLDPKQAAKRPPFRWLGLLIAPESVCAYTPGPRSLNSALRLQDIAAASALLRDRYQSAAQGAETLRRRFAEKLHAQDPLAQTAMGTKFNDLPSSLRQQLTDSIVGGYSEYGFGSADEAANWLTSARLLGGKTQFMVTAAVDSTTPLPSYRTIGLP